MNTATQTRTPLRGAGGNIPNLLQPVVIQISLHTLSGLNEIWDQYPFFTEDLGELEKAFPSIFLKVCAKLQAKEMAKKISPSKKKEFNISLEPFEAVVLKTYINGILHTMPYGHGKNSALMIFNFLDQKLT